MKLPEVKGRNKVRDLKICYGWSVENLTEEELGKRFQMTKQGISRILRNNKDLLKIDKDYEKKKRLHYLGRMLTKHNLVLGKKSSIDIVEQMRKEIEGDKPLVDNRITNISINVKEKSADDIRTGNRITPEPIQSPQR